MFWNFWPVVKFDILTPSRFYIDLQLVTVLFGFLVPALKQINKDAFFILKTQFLMLPFQDQPVF